MPVGVSDGVDQMKDNEYPVPPHSVIRERWMQDMKAEDQTADLRR
jgi:hypothetical protein